MQGTAFNTKAITQFSLIDRRNTSAGDKIVILLGIGEIEVFIFL
jgi:hypothetical protein